MVLSSPTQRTERALFVITKDYIDPCCRQAGLLVKDTSTTAILRGRQVNYTGNGEEFQFSFSKCVNYVTYFNKSETYF
jgi:hypothetical protein